MGSIAKSTKKTLQGTARCLALRAPFEQEHDAVQDLDNASAIKGIDLEITPNDKTEEATPTAQPATVEPFIEPRIKVETVNEVEQVKTEPAQETVAPTQSPDATAAPEGIPGVRRSARVKSAPRGHIPSMSSAGARCGYAVTQLESQEALHPDSHMFFDHCVCHAAPEVAAVIMTQLSLKAGLKE